MEKTGYYFRNKRWVQGGVAAVFFFLLALTTFAVRSYAVNSDMAHWYVIPALNIFAGQGYTTLDGELVFHRAPGFAWMIALFYRLFGVSIWSALGVIQVFSFLTPVMLYLLGKKLANARVGFCAALLCLTSYGMNFWALRRLDPVWPFWVLLSVYAVLEAFDKDKARYLALGGVALGVGFLVKEIVLPFFIFPLLLIVLIGDYRSTTNIKRTVFFYVSLAMTVLPWVVYVYRHTGGLSDIFGIAGLDVLSSMIGFSSGSASFETFYNPSSSVIDNFIRFYTGQDGSLSHWFSLAPVFILSWIFILYRCFRNSKSSIVLGLLLVLFLPVINYLGNVGWHVGEYLYFPYLSCLAVSYAVFSLTKLSFRQRHNHVFIVIMVVLFSFQSTFSYKNDKGYIKFLGDRSLLTLTRVVQSIKHQRLPKREILGGFGSDNFDGASTIGARWLTKRLPQGSNLLVTLSSVDPWIIEHLHPLYFYTGGNFKFFRLPQVYNQYDLRHGDVTPTNTNIIAVFCDFRSADTARRSYEYLFEETLMDYLRERNIDYVVVHPFHHLLSVYFDHHPGFKKIEESPTRFRTYDNNIQADRGGPFVIYQIVNQYISESIRPLLLPYTVQHLKKLSENDPQRFENDVHLLTEDLQIGYADILEALNPE